MGLPHKIITEDENSENSLASILPPKVTSKTIICLNKFQDVCPEKNCLGYSVVRYKVKIANRTDFKLSGCRSYIETPIDLLSFHPNTRQRHV